MVRPKRDQRLRLNPLPRHQVKRHALNERGEHELRLHHRNVITNVDGQTRVAPELARGVKSCRALLISHCGTGLRLIAPERAYWYNRAHVLAPLEPSCTGAEKDLVMYQQSVAPHIDDVPASLWKQWPGCTA